jgi:hypothetical protein
MVLAIGSYPPSAIKISIYGAESTWNVLDFVFVKAFLDFVNQNFGKFISRYFSLPCLQTAKKLLASFEHCMASPFDI